MFDGLLDPIQGDRAMTILAYSLLCSGASLLLLFARQLPWLVRLKQPHAWRIAWLINVAFWVVVAVVGVERGQLWTALFALVLADAGWELLWEFVPLLRKPAFQAALGCALFVGGTLLWSAR